LAATLEILRQALARLFPYDLHEHPLSSAAIEFSVKDLFPWPKIQLAFGDGDNYFSAHDLTLHMGVSVIFAEE
jgi:hypothetical protein